MHAGKLAVIGDVTISELLVLLPQNNSNFLFGITVLLGYIMASTDEIVLL